MSTKAKRPAYLVRVGRAHIRLLASVVIGIVTMLLAPTSAITRMLIGWDVGVTVFVASAALVMAHCASTAQMKRNAAAQDDGAFAILILTVAAGIASLAAIFAELATIERADPNYGFYLALAGATVVLSWIFIQTIFALHYAHDYYGGRSKGGLRFPDESEPDYWDFVYFAFVIGMTFQVSDVSVTQKAIRRMVVGHGVLSFFFATAIVAMTVNIAAGIIQK
jgi:uncharacterized membrane protein